MSLHGNGFWRSVEGVEIACPEQGRRVKALKALKALKTLALSKVEGLKSLALSKVEGLKSLNEFRNFRAATQVR